MDRARITLDKADRKMSSGPFSAVLSSRSPGGHMHLCVQIVLACVFLISSLSVLPPRAEAQSSLDAQDAMDMAYFLSYLEATSDFNTEYDFIHPDARAIIPRAAVVGWFLDNYAPRQPQPATILGVEFVSWTWEVTGATYPNTAEVSFSQTFWDGGLNTVEHDVVPVS